MKYLATPSTEQVRDAMLAGLLGQMVTPNSGNLLLPDVDWALDNGCFADKWSVGKWFACLDRYRHEPRCLFAVVPDVVADAAGTDERWHLYAPVVKALGYKAAYVAQDGCEQIPDDADALFVGGSTEWKIGEEARRLVGEANRRGLFTHMGRVNSLRRCRIAADWGCDSVDGTFLAFGPDTNLPRLLSWFNPAQPGLWGVA